MELFGVTHVHCQVTPVSLCSKVTAATKLNENVAYPVIFTHKCVVSTLTFADCFRGVLP